MMGNSKSDSARKLARQANNRGETSKSPGIPESTTTGITSGSTMLQINLNGEDENENLHASESPAPTPIQKKQ
jgi:hypothetical protein